MIERPRDEVVGADRQTSDDHNAIGVDQKSLMLNTLYRFHIEEVLTLRQNFLPFDWRFAMKVSFVLVSIFGTVSGSRPLTYFLTYQRQNFDSILSSFFYLEKKKIFWERGWRTRPSISCEDGHWPLLLMSKHR